MSAALARLQDVCRSHFEGRTFDTVAELKEAIETLRPSAGDQKVDRWLADLTEAGVDATKVRTLGRSTGPGALALITTSKKGAAETGAFAQAIRHLASFALPDHAMESLRHLAMSQAKGLGIAYQMEPFELGPALSKLAEMGRIIVGSPSESSGLGRLVSWDLDGNLVVSQAGLRAAKSNAPLAQLAILRALFGLKLTEHSIERLARDRKVENSDHHLEIRYTSTGYGARATAAPIADYLAKTLAPALGLNASDVQPIELPSLQGSAYYPGGSHDNRALQGTRALFPSVDCFVYVDPSYEQRQEGHPNTAPEATVTLEPQDATRFETKANVGIFACPGDWAFLMQVPEFVANTVNAIETGGVLLNSTAWQYRPPTYLLPAELLGLSRVGSIAAGGGTFECFVKTKERDREAMTLAVDVDRCLSMLSGFLGGTFSPVKGSDAGEGTLLKKADQLGLRFRSEAWPDFLKEIDARVRASGDTELESAFLRALEKLIAGPADEDPTRLKLRAWIKFRIADREPTEQPIAILNEAVSVARERTLDFESVRYEEFGFGILADGFRPDPDLVERLIRRMASGDTVLSAEDFAAVLARVDADPDQKRAWTERAAPSFGEREMPEMEFTLQR
jgi:hypothetical protein